MGRRVSVGELGCDITKAECRKKAEWFRQGSSRYGKSLDKALGSAKEGPRGASRGPDSQVPQGGGGRRESQIEGG